MMYPWWHSIFLLVLKPAMNIYRPSRTHCKYVCSVIMIDNYISTDNKMALSRVVPKTLDWRKLMDKNQWQTLKITASMTLSCQSWRFMTAFFISMCQDQLTVKTQQKLEESRYLKNHTGGILCVLNFRVSVKTFTYAFSTCHFQRVEGVFSLYFGQNLRESRNSEPLINIEREKNYLVNAGQD